MTLSAWFPWLLGQATPLISLSDSLRASQPLLLRHQAAAVAVDAFNALFRGVSQVCFGDNPLTGLVCFIALLAPTPWPYALCSSLGLLSSTSTAVLCGCETAAVRHGLFGFNGFLLGAAVSSYFDFTSTPHTVAHALLTVAGAALSTAISRSLAVSLSVFSLPTFTMPFNLATLIILAAVRASNASTTGVWRLFALRETGAEVAFPTSTACFAGSATGGSCAVEVVAAVARGVAQVYFCDSAATGAALLVALALCSPVTAAACATGSALGVLAGALLGAPPSELASGSWGYNAVIAAAAVAGVFYELDLRAGVAAVGAALLSALMQACLRTLLAPVALPVLTLPFVLAAFIMLSQRWPLRVALDRVATPEAHATCHAFKCHSVYTHPPPGSCDACAAAARATATVLPEPEPEEEDRLELPPPAARRGDLNRGMGVSRPYLMQQPSRRLLFAWRRSSDAAQAAGVGNTSSKAGVSAYGALDQRP